MNHFHEVHMAALQMVDLLLGRIRTTDPGDAPGFAAALRSVLQTLPWEQVDLAELFEVSPATVSRWVSGRNSPHPIIRKLVLDRVAAEIQRERKKLARSALGMSAVRERDSVS